mmetsp:Transcript_14974/g.45194  ORF Transcript_14974/g.45194 Transcript_14974/m.45194 type:complete len:585 (-) Transcript_14974:822-2576(-)
MLGASSRLIISGQLPCYTARLQRWLAFRQLSPLQRRGVTSVPCFVQRPQLPRTCSAQLRPFQPSASLDRRGRKTLAPVQAIKSAEEKEQDFLRNEKDLKQKVEERMREVYESIDKMVQGSDGASILSVAHRPEASRQLYDRMSKAVAACQQGLIERDVEVRLMLLAALSGEHILFIGPPGTAKSELGRRLSRLYNGPFFERLLTRFSVPEELFGPLSMQALEEDRYVRQTEGYLPTGSVAFIDEIFKANSAILNTLLTILNERLFDNGTERITVPLICLVGASNELPESEELDALYDRFLVRREVKQVSAAGLYDLLRTADTSPNAAPTASDGTEAGAAQPGVPSTSGAPPAQTALVTRDDFINIRLRAAQEVTVPDTVLDVVADLREMLQTTMEPPVYVSDRRLVKAIALLKVSAYTNGRREVSIEDCLLLQHLMWQTPKEADRIQEWLIAQLAAATELKQCRALLKSLFSRAIKAPQMDDRAVIGMADEATELRKVLADKLANVRAAAAGNMPALTQHLWLGKVDAEAAATTLAPKLRKSQTEVSNLLSEAVSLEVCLQRKEQAVAMATLLPERWREFISQG